MSDQHLVGIDHRVGRFDVEPDADAFRSDQRHGVLQQFPHLEGCLLWHRDLRESAEILDEGHQPPARGRDRIQPVRHIGIHRPVDMQQRIAQGGDRRERVHDFMRQDARQLAPRFDLHLAQLAVDVAHDHHAQPAFFEYDLRTSQRQAHFARFGHARHMVLFARADRRQYPVCFGSGQFQLLDVGQARQPEDAQRLAVGLVDASRVVDGD